MDVTLTWYELQMASSVGAMRQMISLKKGFKPRFPARYAGELWATHIIGACAELAACKALGLYWDGSINTFHVSDIPGKNIDVRWSNNGKVKVRPDDEDIRIVHVSGEPPFMKIEGWIAAEHGKHSKYLSDPGNIGRPAYFVPTGSLWDIEVFPR